MTPDRGVSAQRINEGMMGWLSVCSPPLDIPEGHPSTVWCASVLDLCLSLSAFLSPPSSPPGHNLNMTSPGSLLMHMSEEVSLKVFLLQFVKPLAQLRRKYQHACQPWSSLRSPRTGTSKVLFGLSLHFVVSMAQC